MSQSREAHRLWDWYVGELNIEMADYFQRLRPRYRTAILSNGAAGGRREERYGFAELLDDLEANVVAAREVGMRGVRFRSTAQAIAEVEACLLET